MMIWLLFWLHSEDGGSTPPVTPVALPVVPRDGSDQGPLPIWRRDTN